MARDDGDRLRALEARIAAARSRAEPDRPHTDEHYSQAQLAWRMVIELVAGMVIGFGIGFGLDWLFGTTPWLMVVFVLLGFVAGVKTMIRSAGEIQAAALRRAAGAGAAETEPGGMPRPVVGDRAAPGRGTDGRDGNRGTGTRDGD